MLISRVVASAFLSGMMFLGAVTVSAQDYPNKPIRILTSGAGGSSDILSRLIGQGISGPLGQPVVVDNRVILLSIEAVSKAPPDGYTLLMFGNLIWTMPLLQKTSYDPVRDFSPITLATIEPNLLVVHPALPVKTVKDLIALAKARPGELNYASGPTGIPAHLGGELFKALAGGLNIVGIPYKSIVLALPDLMAGQVQLMFASAGPAMQYVKSGKLKALAVTTAQESTLVPGLPTIAASGLPGYELVGLNGVLAPAKTPAAIISRLNQEMVRVLVRPEVKEKFLATGQEIVGSSPEVFAAAIKSDMTKMGKVIKDAGIHAD